MKEVYKMNNKDKLYVDALAELYNTQREMQSQITLLTEHILRLQKRLQTLAEMLLAMQAILNASITLNGVKR